MSASTGQTDEVLAILKREKRFMSSKEIFEKSKIAQSTTEIAVCLIGLQEGKETRIQRISAPPGGRVQYLYAAAGVAVPTATSAGPRPSAAAASQPAGPTPRQPAKPLSQTQGKFRAGLFSDGTMVLENVPGAGVDIELDKEHAAQLLDLIRR